MSTIALSLISMLAGVLGLVLLDDHFKAFEASGWFYLGHHFCALLGSVGLVGLFFETILRGRAREELLTHLRRLFILDREFTKSLNPETRQQFVRDSLKTHLGDDTGEAVYDAVVSRYLERKVVCRRDYGITISLTPLAHDVVLPGGLTLRADRYFRLVVSLQFTRMYDPVDTFHVGCIWNEDAQELNRWFDKVDCMFREVVLLERDDQNRLCELARRLPDDQTRHTFFNQLFDLEISLDHQKLPPKSIVLDPGGHSADLSFSIPKTIKAGLKRHSVCVQTYIARAAGQYPVVLAEPTQNPQISFRYPAGIEALASPYFTSKRLFDPDISNRNKEISIRLKLNGDEPGWVCPSSGVIFHWYEEPAVAAPRGQAPPDPQRLTG
jgi:hypothetical protein